MASGWLELRSCHPNASAPCLHIRLSSEASCIIPQSRPAFGDRLSWVTHLSFCQCHDSCPRSGRLANPVPHALLLEAREPMLVSVSKSSFRKMSRSAK
jgi:hypothetical protein